MVALKDENFMVNAAAHLIPTGAVKRAIDDLTLSLLPIYRNKLRPALPILLKVCPKLGRDIDALYIRDDRHVGIGIFPTRERRDADLRTRNFATAFPGLYSIAGQAVGMQVHTGGVKPPASRDPLTILGDKSGNSVIETLCLFDCAEGSRFNICNVVIKSPKTAIVKFNYRVYLLFLVTFGRDVDAFNCAGALEDTIVQFLTENR